MCSQQPVFEMKSERGFHFAEWDLHRFRGCSAKSISFS